MKKLPVLIVLLFTNCSLQSDPLTYHDLIGFWDAGDYSKVKWNIKDTSTIIMSLFANGELSVSNYKLYLSSNEQILEIRPKIDSLEPVLEYKIVKISQNKLKLDGFLVKYYDQTNRKWIEKTIQLSTIFLRRRNN